MITSEGIISGSKTRKHYSFDKRKYGERQIDLALKGWTLSTNTSPCFIQRGINFAREYGAKEVHVDTKATDIDGKPLSEGNSAVYSRGQENYFKNSPTELLREAKHYLRLRKKGGEAAAQRFLIGVYNQIVRESENLSGDSNSIYANRFRTGDTSLATVLNYFADKLRGLGRKVEAERLEGIVESTFPSVEDFSKNQSMDFDSETGVEPYFFTSLENTGVEPYFSTKIPLFIDPKKK